MYISWYLPVTASEPYSAAIWKRLLFPFLYGVTNTVQYKIINVIQHKYLIQSKMSYLN